MKKIVKPEIELIRFTKSDIIATSGCADNHWCAAICYDDCENIKICPTNG